MRAILQRVKSASVTVEGETVASIGPGLLVLLGVEEGDTKDDLDWLARKTGALRIFTDEAGDWTKSVAEIGGQVIVVSQFTLLASTKKGTKPSWHRAAKPEFAQPKCDEFVAALQAFVPAPVQSGRFGAMMEVALVNDGPVTLVLDSRDKE